MGGNLALGVPAVATHECKEHEGHDYEIDESNYREPTVPTDEANGQEAARCRNVGRGARTLAEVVRIQRRSERRAGVLL